MRYSKLEVYFALLGHDNIIDGKYDHKKNYRELAKEESLYTDVKRIPELFETNNYYKDYPIVKYKTNLDKYIPYSSEFKWFHMALDFPKRFMEDENNIRGYTNIMASCKPRFKYMLGDEFKSEFKQKFIGDFKEFFVNNSDKIKSQFEDALKSKIKSIEDTFDIDRFEIFHRMIEDYTIGGFTIGVDNKKIVNSDEYYTDNKLFVSLCEAYNSPSGVKGIIEDKLKDSWKLDIIKNPRDFMKDPAMIYIHHKISEIMNYSSGSSVDLFDAEIRQMVEHIKTNYTVDHSDCGRDCECIYYLDEECIDEYNEHNDTCVFYTIQNEVCS